MISIDQEELLLDTNIVTYISSNTSWKNEYLPILFGKSLCIGFMTVAELLESAYHRRMSTKNIQRLKEELSIDYKILSFSEEVCDVFAQIRYERRNRPISVSDALIAATALAYELPLVTHNKKDFDGISDLEIITKYTV
ncbi:MAG: PIN domain-containing protein [Planctomycetaceae bacterium]|jgi:predicted nucleic acid-binding protein|nr:PIN domain-containing protein [Planctomycetaceae bacterium]